MDLFTKFYNIERGDMLWSFKKAALGAHKGGSHETASGKLMKLGIQRVIKLEDQQLTLLSIVSKLVPGVKMRSLLFNWSDMCLST